jgi:catechol 2,3-dioxygenase-like lactoylglutathione lyase family enzyme
MITGFSHLTILVKDQDEALKFYTEKLGFKVHTDAPCEFMRWLTICPQNNDKMEFCLMKAESPEQIAQVGKQVAGYGLGVLTTDDCRKDYEILKARGVEFLDEPKDEPWGIGVMLKDLYGNTFYLCQSR